jgi:phage-related protein
LSTVTSLNNYSFAFNGFVFGGSNSPYQIIAVDGLEGLPTLRVQDANRGYLDGMFTGRDFLSGRTIKIQMLILAGNGLSAFQNFGLLQTNLIPQQTGTTPLQFQLSPNTALQFINARVRSRKTLVDPEFTYGFIKAEYEFFCPDPRYYDNTTQTATMTYSTPTGRTYPRVYPLTYGGGSNTQSVQVTNSGWTNTYPQITIYGPVTNPVVGNSTTGQSLNFNYTMAQSDIITIDLQYRTILLNGTPARNLLLGSSTWFAAQPGVNQFYFVGTGTTYGITNATVQWNNAYI